MPSTLAARKPWELACRVHKKLGYLDSPGEFVDWEIYWLSGIVSQRSIGHVLAKVDAKGSVLHASIITNFWEHTKKTNPPIFSEFLDFERNKLIKEGEVGVSLLKHTLSKFLVDHGRSYQDLVEENGEFVGLEWDGEDALRLYEISLVWWHEMLCSIEAALALKIPTPFDSFSKNRNCLLEAARFYESCPETPRL